MPEIDQPIHHSGIRARVLLSSVFGPYARDDAYGSRKINPMELYQNQVTRVQGGFSLRMFHRSFGLMMIQSNIAAPCTLLDFPTLERFTEEIKQNRYDIIGISGIVPNVGKVKKMCELIRRYQPGAEIVIGGHISNKEGLDRIIDADHIVRGEGVRWFQRYLGQDDGAPIVHPLAVSGFGGRMMGIDLGSRPGDTAAILIPSVGCPMGCNFCSTSALFGGKGKFFNFFDTGEQLFAEMCKIEAKMKVSSFFVLDENFLLQKSRALRLLELMEAGGKSWALYVFSSARVLNSYTIDQLVRLGIGWVWMGLEGEASAYDKLDGVDSRALVGRLQSHGIRILGSSIIGLEEHRPENMDAVIDYAIAHETVFHQFMLYTPIPGTPLHERHRLDGSLLPETEFAAADAHGQYRFNYRHPHIPAGREEQYLLEAFGRDFAVNGPSLLRMVRVLLNGWQRHGDDPRPRVRERVAREASLLRTTYAGAVWAIRMWYRNDPRQRERAARLLQDIYGAFGWWTRFVAPLIGLYAWLMLNREESRLAAGWSYEPSAFHEKNAAAMALEKSRTAEKENAVQASRPLIDRPAETFGK